MTNTIRNNHSDRQPTADPDVFKAELLGILSSGGDIDGIIQAGYAALGNPIHVLSGSEDLIARAGSAPESELIWHLIEDTGFPPLPDYARSGRAGDDYIRNYSRLHNDHVDIRNSGTPLIMEAVGTRSRVLGFRLAHQNRFAGNIYVLETNHPFREGDSELLSILAGAVSYRLMRDDFYQTIKGESHEFLLMQLLTRDGFSDEHIRDRIGSVIPGLKPCRAVLTAVCGTRDTRALRLFRTSLEAILPTCRAAIIGDQAVALLHSDSREVVTGAVLSELKKILRSNRLNAGLSNTFTDAAQIREAWQQAQHAIRFGSAIRPDQVLHLYFDYQPHHLLDAISDREYLTLACDPALLRLIDHDLKNKTEYTRTLNAYLEYVGDTAAAARTLNIHYNTMKFRLGKISSFFGPGELTLHRRMLLFLSMRVLELMGDLRFRQCMAPGEVIS